MKPSLKQQLPPGETGAYLFPLCVSLLCYCQGNDKEPHLNCCFQVRGWSFVSCLKGMGPPRFLLFLQATLSHFWKVLGLPKTVLAARTIKEATEGYYLPVEVLPPSKRAQIIVEDIWTPCSVHVPQDCHSLSMVHWCSSFLCCFDLLWSFGWGIFENPGSLEGGGAEQGSFNPVEPKPFCLAMASLYLR